MKVSPSKLSTPYFCMALSVLSLLTLTGCNDSTGDSGAGYLIAYNASNNSPSVALNIEQDGVTTGYSNLAYGAVAGSYLLDAGDYNINFAISTNNEQTQTIYDESVALSGDEVSLIVLSGDIREPELIRYNFDYEDPDTEDEIFNARFLNLVPSNDELTVYFVPSDQAFDEHDWSGQFSFNQLSEGYYFDTDYYRFYIANSNGDLVYESEEIAMLYTNQQVFAIKTNPNFNAIDGTNTSPYLVDKITSSGGIVTYSSINSDAQVRAYNAMDLNALLPDYNGVINLHLDGISAAPLFSSLARHDFSDVNRMQTGDYQMDITATSSQTKLTASQILSLPTNSDKTVFFYLTEVEEADDGNDDTAEEVELFVNTLITENNPVEGVYHHEIQLVNFVEDHTSVTVYFVPANETISTTDYKLVNYRATANKIALPNDEYDIFVIAKEGQTDVLLAKHFLTLSIESKNQYLIIEQQDKDIDDFILTMFDQN